MATYTDQFYVLDPSSPPPVGTALSPVLFNIVDANNNGLIEANGPDTVDGQTVTGVWPGDTVTVKLADGTQVTYTGTTFYLNDYRVVFTPGYGKILQPGTLASASYVTTPGDFPVRDLGPPCFTPGTLIATPCGERPVETLQPGDLVLTADGAAAPVLFLHQRVFSGDALAERPNCQPIEVAPGALGAGLPRRRLVLSRQHRMLLRSRIIERMYGTAEVLAPVAHLTEAPGIQEITVDQVTYIHVVLADHQVLMAEGALAESLFLGPQAEDGFTESELAALRKRLNGRSGPVTPARQLERGPKLRKAVARHVANGKDLCAAAERPSMLAVG